MENDTIESNKLIAEFMGGKLKYYNVSNEPYYLMPDKQKWMPERLVYHTSWDWLMPVVEEIERLDDGNFSFFIVQTECDIAFSSKHYDDSPNFAQKKGDKLLSTWSAVIEFIKWYNLSSFS